jgi:hypothetical protein
MIRSIMADYAELSTEEAGDRLVIKLDPGGPIELAGLTESFAALARMYERHYRRDETAPVPSPKLYVTRLETGSIVAEIAPYAVLLGTVITTMDSGMIVSDFSRRLWTGIRAFSNPGGLSGHTTTLLPSVEDAEDIRAFVRPLTGKNGAALGIRHAKFERRDGPRKTVVEYSFDENELNRAAVNIDRALSSGFPLEIDEDQDNLTEPQGTIRKEVMLFFEQASRRPGKESGRTGDRAIVPDVSDKSLPVYFRKSFQDLKDQMVRGDVNPLTNFAFVVDVHVQIVDGKPKAYVVTDVHKVIPLSD